MGKVILEGMEFFAHHGLYAEEQKIGNKFSVDVFITTDFAEAATTDQLSKTINYKAVYDAVAHVMGEKHKLLEHVAERIATSLKADFDAIDKIEVHVSKYNPPVGGICHRSRVVHEA